MARGTARTIAIKVTAKAIRRLRMAVVRYAGTVKMLTKFSKVNPGTTFEVNGLMNQKAVINKKKSDPM